MHKYHRNMGEYMSMIELVKGFAENRYRYGKDKEADKEIIEAYLEYKHNNGPTKENPCMVGTEYPYTREQEQQRIYQAIDKNLKIVPKKELPLIVENEYGKVVYGVKHGVHIVQAEVGNEKISITYDRQPTRTQVKQDILLGIHRYTNPMFFTLRDIKDGRWYVK